MSICNAIWFQVKGVVFKFGLLNSTVKPLLYIMNNLSMARYVWFAKQLYARQTVQVEFY